MSIKDFDSDSDSKRQETGSARFTATKVSEAGK